MHAQPWRQKEKENKSSARLYYETNQRAVDSLLWSQNTQTQHLQKELDRGTSHNGQMRFQITSLYERNCFFLFWVLNMFFLSLWWLVSSFETGKQEPRRLSHLVLYRNDERDKPSAAGKQSTEDGRRRLHRHLYVCLNGMRCSRWPFTTPLTSEAKQRKLWETGREWEE